MARRNEAVPTDGPRAQQLAGIQLLDTRAPVDAPVRDCPTESTVPTVGGRVLVDLSDSLTATNDEHRAHLYWSLVDVPDGTEVVVRVGRTLPNLSGCFPEVDVVPRVHLTVEGPDAESVRTAVREFRAALAQWTEQTDTARAERQEREAQRAADRAWFAGRRQAVVG